MFQIPSQIPGANLGNTAKQKCGFFRKYFFGKACSCQAPKGRGKRLGAPKHISLPLPGGPRRFVSVHTKDDSICSEAGKKLLTRPQVSSALRFTSSPSSLT